MLAEEIRKFLKGDVLDDAEALAKYSRDASIFVIQPEVVVCPRDVEDIKVLVKWASSKQQAENSGHNAIRVSLTARSAGTDMGGGPLTESVVVDMTKYMNKFVGIREAGSNNLDSRRSLPRTLIRGGNDIRVEGYATVQPGMYYRDFEKETLAAGLLMPSYPASRDLCTVGGMVMNNAGGEKTLSYGKTEEYIEELKMVLADGEEHIIRALTSEELDKKCADKNFEGEFYSRLRALVEKNDQLLRRAKPDVSKNSAGYYLWNVWDADRKVFDLTRLMVGSQGTFGIVTEITFRLVRPKQRSLMAVLFLKDLTHLADVVSDVLKFQPESFESYDDKTLKLAIRFFPQILVRVKQNPIRFALGFLPDLWMLIRYGWPKLVLLVELTGDTEEEIYPKLQDLQKTLEKHELIFKAKKHANHERMLVHLTKHGTEEEKYWITRRESFSLLRKNVKGKHTAPVIDDFIVKPEYLPEFLPELNAMIAKYSKYLTSTVAGHMGNGNFHIIPLMDFKKPEARAVLRPLMEEVYALVLKYKGSITAEHNDGLVRTPYLEKMYGAEVVALFAEAKEIFDPAGIFNPGKKVPVAGMGLGWAMEHMTQE